MANEKLTLEQELLIARKKAKKVFTSMPQIISSQGLAGESAVGVFFDMCEFKERVIESYKDVFLERGLDFTQGYLEGRKGQLGNIFSKKYKAAKRAFSEMEEARYKSK